MTRQFLFLAVLLALLCSQSSAQTTITERPEWKRFYDKADVHGCFVLYHLNTDSMWIYNRARSDSGFLPASTFKIPNSLIALETGVLKDEHDTLPWDGVKRQVPTWNADQDMRRAIKFSTVWFYQEIARRVGAERMQRFVDSMHYGNTDISGGIDLFWLEGGLLITPRQEIDFLVRFYKNDLPFSQRSLDIVKDIMILEKSDEYILRGKTGWAGRVSAMVGWWVGYLERGSDIYFFANNIAIVEDEDAEARRSVALDILRYVGLLPATPDSTR
ncbi:MAG: class D beta-lactamase [Bacteroidota bacterium]